MALPGAAGYDLAVSEPAAALPKICLNMIVRNEAHVIQETLNEVAPYLSAWVIVDTGSDDGTQELIKRHMAALGIPGELHERPWLNFGHNRSEALLLAQGHGDYIWVVDADDKPSGTIDFTQLSADIYSMRIAQEGDVYWRPQLFRAGLPIRYEGVVHEYVVCDAPNVLVRLEGNYHIESRRLGARNLDPQKYARDRDLLLAEIERDPDDPRSVFYLAQSYYDLGDFVNACEWYARRAEMSGWSEETYLALYRQAEALSCLDAPWPDVQDAYLRAWEFRPTRAEALYAIALRYRQDQRYQLGYLFARHAAEIPFPDTDELFVRRDIHGWRAIDEQAVCGSWIGKYAEAFTLWRQLLARADITDEDRRRIAQNRDLCVPTMIAAASPYPDAALLQRLVADNLAHPKRGPSDPDIAVSLIAGPDRETTEQTLNSFLRCCTDITRVRRFLVFDAGLSESDQSWLLERYGFLEFAKADPAESSTTPHSRIAYARTQIHEKFWLHLGQGWRFFAPENLITRLTAVLQNEPEVFQVAINFTDALTLTGSSASESSVRRTPAAGRYVLTDTVANGPAMCDTTRAVTLGTASLDEVLCITAVRPE
ncbi:MAG: glycosyltransferase [Mycobacteriaceae bacterium]|nr:glycosyltransferase [Mycobacteriaceae bacterium]